MSGSLTKKRPHPSQSCLAPTPKLTIIEEVMPISTVDMAEVNSKAERGKVKSNQNKSSKTIKPDNPQKPSENVSTALNYPETAPKGCQEEATAGRTGSIEETLELILQKVSCLPTIQSDVKAISDELNEQKKSLQYVHDDVDTLKKRMTEYEGQMVEMDKRLKALEEERREFKDLQKHVLHLEAHSRRDN